jgi:prepilin-type N-terminal cleavage/methylation domain-containing protein
MQLARKQRQRGDTLVEVLISIAIVSLVLGGAYVTTNRSLTATRAAQERSNALKLAEGQVEQLKAIIAATPDQVFGPTAPLTFCVYNGAIIPNVPANVKCAVDSKGVQTTAEPVFHITVQRTGNDFAVNELWSNAGGKNTDHVDLKYRIYQ